MLPVVKPLQLRFLSNRQKELEERNAFPDQHRLELRRLSQKVREFGFAAKSHHPFNTGPVVPGPVEQYDFTGTGQVLHVPLEIPVSALSFGWVRRCARTRMSRVQMLHGAF